ncbi:DUF2243 domain-containing protein [Halostagnicola sp. A-GB9-2]|uniref:DUF2243 domain-containing protein n=1 Tax=Halostagnicola sp. A-GB9-2 TaxID=3048066 RepID=UPI0024BF5E2B|nr:DUF2243 domain-containing protein [Halostagnicola sp. A-GB9-2]MDJ1431028.1 DUF2243 domain-containing protein [Halostagnicola sp. A-GB9-2]
MSEANGPSRRRPFFLAGVTVGIGFGAVLDVIIFHLTFQTHHLFSGFYDPYSYDGLRTNVMFDGVFLLAMVAVTALGLGMVWRVVNRTDEALSTLFLLGSIVVGMGLFNLVDGVVSHEVLDLHNVVHGTEAWNLPWIVVSVLMLALGFVLLKVAGDHRRGSN